MNRKRRNSQQQKRNAANSFNSLSEKCHKDKVHFENTMKEMEGAFYRQTPSKIEENANKFEQTKESTKTDMQKKFKKNRKDERHSQQKTYTHTNTIKLNCFLCYFHVFVVLDTFAKLLKRPKCHKLNGFHAIQQMHMHTHTHSIASAVRPE